MTRDKLTKIGTVALLAWLANCSSDASGPPNPRLPVSPETSILQMAISEPVASLANVSASGGSSAGAAYVAFATGEQPDWQSVRLRNLTSGLTDTTRYAVVDGGLDPIGIAADVGDTLQLDVVRHDGSTASLKAGVPSKRAPRVVRTSPAVGRTDVAVNVRILVVFSEPVDAATLTSATVQLLNGSEAVEGTFQISGAGTLVEFQPAQALLPATSYVLVVNRGVQDLSGDSLQQSIGAQFQTGNAVGPVPVATLTINAPVTALTIGSTLQFSAVLKDAAGNTLTGRAVTWSSSNAAAATVSPLVSLSAIGVVNAIAVGTTNISASSGGRTAQVAVTVTNSPSTVRITTTSTGEDIPETYTLWGLWDQPSPFEPNPVEVISANGTVTFPVPSSNGRQVYLNGIPGHCSLSTPNPQFSGALPAGETVSVGFAIECALREPTQSATSQPIAFVRDQDILAVNLDGSGEVRLTNSGTNSGPAWSPDGARLAFASDRTGSMDLYVMNADGSNVMRRGFTHSGDPAWSPDGRQIAFASLCEGQGCILTTSADDDGVGPDRIGHSTGQHFAPAWSPDGSSIAFVSDWVAYDFVFDIYVSKVDGSEITQLTQGFAFWPDLKYYLHPVWSPDGSRIAFVYGSIINSSDMRFRVAVMQADGTGKQDLAWAGDIPWRDLLDPGSIAWSPDGSRIAFSFVDCDLATRIICTNLRSIKYVTVDGGQEGLIVSNGHGPSWRR